MVAHGSQGQGNGGWDALRSCHYCGNDYWSEVRAQYKSPCVEGLTQYVSDFRSGERDLVQENTCVERRLSTRALTGVEMAAQYKSNH